MRWGPEFSSQNVIDTCSPELLELPEPPEPPEPPELPELLKMPLPLPPFTDLLEPQPVKAAERIKIMAIAAAAYLLIFIMRDSPL
ncbi:hypothetical protein D3C77_550010 [compost metagenome]